MKLDVDVLRIHVDIQLVDGQLGSEGRGGSARLGG